MTDTLDEELSREQDLPARLLRGAAAPVECAGPRASHERAGRPGAAQPQRRQQAGGPAGLRGPGRAAHLPVGRPRRVRGPDRGGDAPAPPRRRRRTCAGCASTSPTGCPDASSTSWPACWTSCCSPRRACLARAPQPGELDSPAWLTSPHPAATPSRKRPRRALRGGAPKYHQKLAEQGKLFVRERLRLLLDDADGFAEDGLLRERAGRRPAGRRRRHRGRRGPRPPGRRDGQRLHRQGRARGARATVEKIIRIIELARGAASSRSSTWSTRPGARITDQVDMFPGRRGAGKIFYNQVQASGQHPAGLLPVRAQRGRRRVHPGVLRRGSMVEHNASMYLGSPRMAEEVIGEQVTLEEMGGARMHCRGQRAAATCWFPTTRPRSRRRAPTSPTSRSRWRERPADGRGAAAGATGARWPGWSRRTSRSAFDMYALIAGVVDD